MIVKRYEGPDRSGRRLREFAALTTLRDLLPVPRLLAGTSDGALRMEFVAGVHGQELIESGHAVQVLRACGDVLRRIHAVEVAHVLADGVVSDVRYSPDLVVVHGDFGPNNLLVDPTTFAVTAVLDWEWTHPGDPVEDLAWCEWIIRMHHPHHIDALADFFDAYGRRPSWTQRHEAMQAQCQRLLDLCRESSSDGTRLWQHRLETTTTWTE